MSVRGTKEALSSTIQQRRSDPRTSRVCTLYPNKALVNGGKRLFFLTLLIDFFEGSCDPISSGAEAVIYMPCKLNQSFSTDRSEGSVAPGSLFLGKLAPSRGGGGGWRSILIQNQRIIPLSFPFSLSQLGINMYHIIDSSKLRQYALKSNSSSS